MNKFKREKSLKKKKTEKNKRKQNITKEYQNQIINNGAKILLLVLKNTITILLLKYLYSLQQMQKLKTKKRPQWLSKM